MKSEIENYPHLILILVSWWNFEHTHRELKIRWNYLHGMTLAFSVLGRFELSDEIDFLKKVLDQKILLKYLSDRGLDTFTLNQRR